MIKSIFDINNKVAVITGTSRGIGLALAKGFLDHGAFVNGISRSDSPLVGNEKYIHYNFDLNDRKLFNKLVSKIKDNHECINVLINSAGLSLPFSHNIEEAKIDFEKTLDINLKSSFSLTYAIVDLMKTCKSGSIINITSIASNLGFPLNPSYISSKAGLAGLTRSLSYDFAKYGIRVNNLVPGYFKTDMTKDSFLNSKMNNERSSRSLLLRWGEPSELVGPAIFLASSASSFVTGTDLVVDGGWSVKGI